MTRIRRRVARVIGASWLLLLAACAAPAVPVPEYTPSAAEKEAPERFTIVPDDYHVPFAGTAADGRRFFLSRELFDVGPGRSTGYVGLFLWSSSGKFEEVRADPIGAAGPDALVAARLAELGEYVLEPVTVEPFAADVDGVTFGWKVGRYDNGMYFISIEPGDFIAYSWPWDGVGYDT